MTERERMPGAEDCGADVAAFVLGALSSREAQDFRAHMERCAVCRDEVQALEGVVGVLPMAAPQYEAPRHLRKRVMRQVRSERGGPALSAVSWHWRSLNRARAVAAGCAAAVVAGAGALTAVELGAGAAATVIQARVSGVAGSAQLRVAGGHAELIVRHLTPAGHGRVYEVWLQSGSSAPVPASVLFDVAAGGDADVGLPASLRGVSTVMVTAEPLGGSDKPTHAPVIVARLD